MNKSNNPKSKEDINLRGVFKGFYRKKWWFVGTFIMVLVAGLLVTFIRDKGYNAGSEIEINTIKNSYLYSLQVNFPEEASKLRTRDLKNVSSELESDEILEEVSGRLSFSISKDELLDAIYISTNNNTDILTININYTSPQSATEINNKLLNAYIDKKNSELNNIYDALTQKVEKRVIDIHEEIVELSSEIQEYVRLKDLKEEGPNINFEVANYIPPDLSIKLDYLSSTYSDLEILRYILAENKEFFTSEIEVLKEPEITNILKNRNYIIGSLVSLFAAIISGLIVIFTASYFSYFRRKI